MATARSLRPFVVVLRAVAAAGVLLASALAPSAWAAFPGRNGSIAFEVLQVPHCNQGRFGVYTVSGNGSNFRRLNAPRCNQGPPHPIRPAYSPSGHEIAFNYISNTSVHRIITMHSDGTHARRIFGIGQKGNIIGRVAYSPDGSRIAFAASKRSHGERFLYLFTVRSDGTHLRRVLRRRVLMPLYGRPGPIFDPTWSPNGKRIAFGAQNGSSSAIDSVAPDGTDLETVKRGPSHPLLSSPDYSPNGKRIVYVAAFDFTSRIVTMRANGTDTRVLTHEGKRSHEPAFPAYSPNGKKIAFVRRYRSRAAQALCTMAADGSHFRTITSPFYAIGFPSWQPLR